MNNNMKKIYDILLKEYGLQGWWPILDYIGENPTKTGSISGYHQGDYSFPRNDDERFEICAGAILTQSTAWTNVEKALLNLKKRNVLNEKGIIKLSHGKLKELIRPAGYFNQKAKKLKKFAEFYIKMDGKTPHRDELLDVWGIGPETADSILLYAYKVPSFVVDAYTRRIFSKLGMIDNKSTYDEIKSMFEDSLDRDYRIYQEFHALIVEHAKRCYSKGGDECMLQKQLIK